MTKPLKTYRAVLAGTGSIGDAHVRAIESMHGRVKLVAAADLDAKRVADFAARVHIPETFTDFATMLRATPLKTGGYVFVSIRIRMAARPGHPWD